VFSPFFFCLLVRTIGDYSLILLFSVIGILTQGTSKMLMDFKIERKKLEVPSSSQDEVPLRLINVVFSAILAMVVVTHCPS